MKVVKLISFLLCGVLFFTMNGCGVEKSSSYDVEKSSGYDVEKSGRWSCAWCVYWDEDIREELTELKDNTETVSLFSCYFDDEGDIYIPENLSELQKLTENIGYSMTYLSFTNDVQHGDGSATQKDVAILQDLWQDEESMQHLADEILATAQLMNVRGIEIDFENITETEMWGDYSKFLNILWREARANNFSMRVILGVNAPIETCSFPEEPVYVVMCYNLYGTHSGPGPKADTEFLTKTAEKFSALQNVEYALATGGFQWDAGNKAVQSLTQEDAEALMTETGSVSERDEESWALYYYYEKEGSHFTVWYGDAQTLDAWRSVILKTDSDAKFNLWRVGGNKWK